MKIVKIIAFDKHLPERSFSFYFLKNKSLFLTSKNP